jgi:organic radical activating enzyme
MSRSYRINEIFYSLQGEGVRTGVPHLFLRFAGCNKNCRKETEGFDCDTDFEASTPMTAADIVSTFKALSSSCRWVLLTGGEPLLQLDTDLCSAIKREGYKLAIETNGTVEPPAELLEQLDWIACSPKRPYQDIVLGHCDELKIVLANNDQLPIELPLNAEHKLVSPAFVGGSVDTQTIDWCSSVVKNNPEWRLSLQSHKLIQIP